MSVTPDCHGLSFSVSVGVPVRHGFEGGGTRIRTQREVGRRRVEGFGRREVRMFRGVRCVYRNGLERVCGCVCRRRRGRKRDVELWETSRLETRP